MLNLHYTRDSRGLFGLKLGVSLLSQSAALSALHASGFYGDVPEHVGPSGSLVLEKNSSIDTEGFEVGVYLEWDDAGNLCALGALVGVIPLAEPLTSAEIENVVWRLRDFFESEMGPSTLHGDNVEGWANQPAEVRETTVAYVALWPQGATPDTSTPQATLAGLQESLKQLDVTHGALLSIGANQDGFVSVLSLLGS